MGIDTRAPVRAVIFDYGHTFLDFRLAEDKLLACYQEIRALLQALAQREVPEAPELVDLVARRVGQMVLESYARADLEELDILARFEEALSGAGFSVPAALVQQIAEMEHRAGTSGLYVPPQNLEVLETLRSHGLKLGLVSNAHFLPELMREDVTRLGIMSYIDDAVFSAEVGVRKPHPAIFMKVLDALGVTPREAVFVGDRVREDIQGPQELGMRAILTHEFRQEDPGGLGVEPDLIVERLPEVVPYVLELLAAA